MAYTREVNRFEGAQAPAPTTNQALQRTNVTFFDVVHFGHLRGGDYVPSAVPLELFIEACDAGV